MVRTFLKAYMKLGSYFLFLQEQIKDIIIILKPPPLSLLGITVVIFRAVSIFLLHNHILNIKKIFSFFR
jgi:hypothetical protein